MRKAIIKTLQALYDGKEVTASNSLTYLTTRITNEISILRNSYGIAITTDRIHLSSKRWYGSYRLVRSDNNIKKVREILKIDSTIDEVSRCKN